MAYERKVFISYRRGLSLDLAGRVRDYLVSHEYDVFLDLSNIKGGRFAEIILDQIAARPLFVPILAVGCFKRAGNPKDLFRREIEHALANHRYIVPLAAQDFCFEKECTGRPLPGRLSELIDLDYIEVPPRYFDAAMERLAAGLSAMPSNVNVQPIAAGYLGAVAPFLEATSAARPDRGRSWNSPSPFALLRPRILPIQLSLREDPLPAPTLNVKNRFRLYWSKVAAAVQYVLYKDTDASFPNSEEIYRGPHTDFIITDYLPPHDMLDYFRSMENPPRTQYYRVRAVNENTFGEWSNVVEVSAEPRPDP